MKPVDLLVGREAGGLDLWARPAGDDPMTEVFVVGLILWIITVVALLVSLL